MSLMIYSNFHNRQSFRLSKPLANTSDDDKINLLTAISNNFDVIVQGNNVNTGGSNNITVDLICKVMIDPQFGGPIERVGLVNRLILNEYRETQVYFEYKPMIEALAQTSIESAVAGGSRQWMYQMCTQMGFFPTTDNRPHLFGNMIPIEFYVKQCSLVFGPTVNATSMASGISENNLKHRGLWPKVKNVISLQGSLDPWHSVGITKSIPNMVQAVFIPGTAHCADMYGSSPKDLPQLTNARRIVVQFLTKLLADSQSRSKATPETKFTKALGSLVNELSHSSTFSS